MGPGTYKPLLDSLTYIPDQSGDVKLELNTELRPRISGPLYGAIFIDAGNIWLKNTDSLKPGATIDKDFLSELFMGAGVGLRLDIQLFVIRLDVAFPIRDASRPKGQRFVFKEVSGQNLVYNLAIGYPF